MDVGALRASFSHVPDHTYLNHAAVCPLSKPVRAAIDVHLSKREGTDPSTPIENFDPFQYKLERAKKRTARVLGTESRQIEFIPNTSTGINILCRGLNWREGDRVAVPDGTFPTNVYPFLNLKSEGVEVDFIPTREGAYSLEDIEQTLRSDTRLLSVSWVHFLSGFRMPLSEIGALCNAHDVFFCVDAIQGLGALQIDVEEAEIDFLVAGGHKWLMATQGIGVLYCDESFREGLHPPAGWLHGPVDWEHLDQYELTFHDDARCFRMGTRNSIGIVALDAALGLYLEMGADRCEALILELARTLAEELNERGFSQYGDRDLGHGSGIVTVSPEKPEALFDHLQARNISVALRNRKVRFSPTYYNNDTDLRVVLDAVDAFRQS